MSELTAAVALAQLARVAPMIAKVRSLRDTLRGEIGDISGVTWRRIPDPKGDIGFETYLFMPSAEQAQSVRSRAGERGVTLTPHTGTYAQTAREYVKNRSTHAAGRSPFQHYKEWPAPGYRPEDFPRTHDLGTRAAPA